MGQAESQDGGIFVGSGAVLLFGCLETCAEIIGGLAIPLNGNTIPCAVAGRDSIFFRWGWYERKDDLLRTTLLYTGGSTFMQYQA